MEPALDSNRRASGLVRLRPTPEATTRLLILPHAGSGVGRFHALGDLLPRSIEPWAVCLPGRERRLAEPPLDSMKAVVEEVRALVDVQSRDPGWVLFGHSMGGLVAWELARHLEPRLLAVSGARSPDDPVVDTELVTLDDRGLMSEMRTRFGGFPPEVDDYPELIELSLDTLRADLVALAAYRAESVEPLDIPIVAFRGASDTVCSRGEVGRWDRCTNRAFRMREFPGGHHYLFDHPHDVVAALRADIRSLSDG